MLTTLLTVNLFSQINDVVASDSLTKSLDLDNLRKISFKDGNVIATYSDGTSQSSKMSGSDKLRFTTDKQDEEVSEGASRYTIYDLSGRPVKTHTDRSCDQPFDLNDLGSGIYLLKTGNRTIKIVK